MNGIDLRNRISWLVVMASWLVLSACSPDHPQDQVSAGDASEDLSALVDEMVDAPVPVPDEVVDRMTRPAGGDGHALAMDDAARVVRDGLVMSEFDRDDALSWINDGKPDEMDVGEWHERVNGLLNVMRSRPAGDVEPIVDVLISMVNSEDDHVLRLYALQHLSFFHPMLKSPAAQQEVTALMNDLARRPGEPTAGSALMMMSEMNGREGDRPMDPEVARAAVELVGSQSASLQVRVTAMHVCVEQSASDVLPEARRIAPDVSQSVILRKAAVFAIGHLGDYQDIAMLEPMLGRLSSMDAPAKHAIRRIENKRAE